MLRELSRVGLACAAVWVVMLPARAGVSDRAETFNRQGVELFSEGRYSEALRSFLKALKEDSDAAEIRANVGKSYAAIAVKMIEAAAGKGDRPLYRRALENLELALVYWPGDDDTHHATALCHLRLGQLQTAKRSLERAVAANSQTFRSWRLLGVVLERLHQLDAAHDAFEKARQLRPHDEGVQRRLKRLRYDQRALADYQSLKSTRFRIYYPSQIPLPQAQTILRALDGVAEELERRWDLHPPRDEVVICYPPGEFARHTGLHDDVGGAFDGRIRIAYPAELKEGGLELRQVVRHEAVHLMLRKLGEHPPRWIDEGLAQYLDGEVRGPWEKPFRDLIRRSPNVGIEARQTRFRDDDPKTWGPLYMHAYFFFRHLGATHQDFRLDMLVREVAHGTAWDTAFRRVFGVPAAELDREWRRTLLRDRTREP